jgi:hypothetical protein
MLASALDTVNHSQKLSLMSEKQFNPIHINSSLNGHAWIWGTDDAKRVGLTAN